MRPWVSAHDVELISAGADAEAAISRALFVAIVNARQDPPDAARRHAAKPAESDDPGRII